MLKQTHNGGSEVYPYQVDVSQVLPAATNDLKGHLITIGLGRYDHLVVVKIEPKGVNKENEGM